MTRTYWLWVSPGEYDGPFTWDELLDLVRNPT